LLEEFLSAFGIFYSTIIRQVEDPIHLLSLVEVIGYQENYFVSEERALLYLCYDLRGDARIKGAQCAINKHHFAFAFVKSSCKRYSCFLPSTKCDTHLSSFRLITIWESLEIFL
jgi:hypothetical protein